MRLALFIAALCLATGLAFGIARSQILAPILYARTHAAACGTLSFVFSNACNIISIGAVMR